MSTAITFLGKRKEKKMKRKEKKMKRNFGFPWFFLIENRLRFWELLCYTKGIFLETHHVLRPIPFHSASHLCTFPKPSHQCNIIPLPQNWSQQDWQKESQRLGIYKIVVGVSGEGEQQMLLGKKYSSVPRRWWRTNSMQSWTEKK